MSNNMKFNPLRDGLFIERDPQETKSQGGIVLPESAKEAPLRGTVVKAGPGRTTSEGERIAMSVQPGDKVLFGQYSGTKVTIENQEYLFMKEEDILAVEEA